MQVALVPLFPFLLISCWCGLLVPSVGLYPVLCMKSGGGNFSFCAVDVLLRLGVSYSSVAAWAYVIMGGTDSPSFWGGGMFAIVFCVATPACGSGISRCRIQLSWILSLFVACCICEKFGGSWIGVRWLSTG
jgi:hypothetical protein